ncbi:hypothetical protein L7F22_067975 [Adiantum nelumboides]|nr:hypothetical protein [Adiantum nelumboides]
MPDGSAGDAQFEAGPKSSTTVADRDGKAPAGFDERDGPSSPRKTMTRAQLASRIAQGETLVLHRRRIYKLDSWLARHPGGDLAILHFVGRDASDEIEAYHCDETLKRMRSFVVAMLDENDWEAYKPLVPPVQLGYRSGKLDHPDAQWVLYDSVRRAGASESEKENGPRPQGFPLPTSLLEPPPDPPGINAAHERALSRAYRRMHDDIKRAGLYTLRPAGYARECTRYFALAATAWYLWHMSLVKDSVALYMASSVFLGLFWHQLTFTAHDAGHTGITHSHFWDRLLGSIIADWIGGLSIGWWCDNHDVHHLVTNHPEHDPDIQHMPFFAISPRFLVEKSPQADGAHGKKETTFGLWSSYYRRVLLFDAPSRVFLSVQHKIYYLVMSLGRFNLYANSYGFLLFKAKKHEKWFWIEAAGIAFFWYWFGAIYLASAPGWGSALAALLVSHIVTSPLHVQIVLSHFAQSSEDLGLSESFASRQVRTTMDVQCPPWLDFLHGGLHMQVSHHLFPRLPRHNLREARDRFVRPFCATWGLQYEEYGFKEGNGKVLKTLGDVANQVRIMGKVAKAQAQARFIIDCSRWRSRTRPTNG